MAAGSDDPFEQSMPPPSPDEYTVRFTDTRHGRIRSRTLGEPAESPPVVTVMGMAVSDYLLPAQAALTWTRTHLLDLPGLAGSGDAPRRLEVPEYAEAVCDWLDAAGLPPVVLVGHSSGTQVAAHAAAARPELVAATGRRAVGVGAGPAARRPRLHRRLPADGARGAGDR
jgi:pimeloyl-ACP methyl ester carboxylesterase